MRYLILVAALVFSLGASAQNTPFVSLGLSVSPGYYHFDSDISLDLTNPDGTKKETIKLDYKYKGIVVSPVLTAGYKIKQLSLSIAGRYTTLTSDERDPVLQGFPQSEVKITSPSVQLRANYDLVKSKLILAPMAIGSFSNSIVINDNNIIEGNNALGYGLGLSVGYEVNKLDFMLTPMFMNSTSSTVVNNHTIKNSIVEPGAELSIRYRFKAN
jgi:hypothetical protein